MPEACRVGKLVWENGTCCLSLDSADVRTCTLDSCGKRSKRGERGTSKVACSSGDSCLSTIFEVTNCTSRCDVSRSGSDDDRYLFTTTGEGNGEPALPEPTNSFAGKSASFVCVVWLQESGSDRPYPGTGVSCLTGDAVFALLKSRFVSSCFKLSDIHELLDISTWCNSSCCGGRGLNISTFSNSSCTFRSASSVNAPLDAVLASASLVVAELPKSKTRAGWDFSKRLRRTSVFAMKALVSQASLRLLSDPITSTSTNCMTSSLLDTRELVLSMLSSSLSRRSAKLMNVCELCTHSNLLWISTSNFLMFSCKPTKVPSRS
mmetsp:Transcript_96099/g.184665  ORF Transcript_96099/g.184665 Transcript_96099/m.184665 type:complete len:320 (-) Transcript_96099:206-1165(-)